MFPQLPSEAAKFRMRSSLSSSLGLPEEAGPVVASSAAQDPGQPKQKTFPCPQCGKIFNAHYNLTRHMPVHTGKILHFI